MTCKKGGFVSIRYNDLRDLNAKMLSQVCKDIEIQPKLTPITGEELDSRTANITNETRFDFRTGGVWSLGKRATSIFRFKSFSPQRLPLFQEVVATVSTL